MSTHNIGFYEDLTKIIFELSSNIIKYAPYFSCWTDIKADLFLLIVHTFNFISYAAAKLHCRHTLQIKPLYGVFTKHN